MTRNITLAVEDELLERYRAEAVRQKTSVNAMIRKHMAAAVGASDAERLAAVERMRARAARTPYAEYAPEWDRASIYDRGE